MPEPFKNVFNLALIDGMAEHFHRHYTEFDKNAFIDDASHELDSLELKARSNQIISAMISYLPKDSSLTFDILEKSLLPIAEQLNVEQVTAGLINSNGISGWAIMPMADYVGIQYMENNNDVDFYAAMNLLKEMTKRFSAEFGIRYLIKAEPNKALAVLNKWAKDDNQHVRRLASEGSRPRLPWGMQLSCFIENPRSIISLLEKLKDDKEEYVRRSVANNLNDIAKDHPDLIAQIAKKWLVDASKNRTKLIKHACRTLIKNGDKKVLSAFDFKPVKLKYSSLILSDKTLAFGNSINLTLALESQVNHDQNLNIDYVIHHQKANRKTSPKVFKWQSKTLKANDKLILSKKHTIKKITTRVYYPGIHKIEILINGDVVCENQFTLIMDGQ